MVSVFQNYVAMYNQNNDEYLMLRDKKYALACFRWWQQMKNILGLERNIGLKITLIIKQRQTFKMTYGVAQSRVYKQRD